MIYPCASCHSINLTYMFETLEILPTDPILGLSAAFNADDNPNKIDLGVGVYRDKSGSTPVLSSIKAAERAYIELENTKAYTAPEGVEAFNRGIQKLLFGQQIEKQRDLTLRLSTVQTPGGCGALRVAAELVKRSNPDATVWLSNPSWANHRPLLGNAGLQIKEYPYYDAATGSLDFDAMLAALSQVNRGDIVLVHACCHNPTGADLTQEQWRDFAGLASSNGFTPFIDLAYQGFAIDVDSDAYSVRLLAEAVPELLVATSCSKNFGLYRERTGALTIIANNEKAALATHRQALSIARGIYSMPPAHGAALVATVLSDQSLHTQWLEELGEMRNRMTGLRRLLVENLDKLSKTGDFRFINNQHGMFSLLGLSPEQVNQLRESYSIYMTANSRINVAGISEANVEYLSNAIVNVIH